MANLTFKQAIQTPPSSTTTKGSLLSAAEVDGNMASLNADIQTRLLRSGDRLEGALDWNGIPTIASASTTSIGPASSNVLKISGTTAITSFGSALAGVERLVLFTGALTLTHNATSLILPYGQNIVTVAGDSAVFVSLGSGNWQCTTYSRDVTVAGTTDQYLRGDKSWADLFTGVRNAVLTGLSLVSTASVAATDTVLVAIGKLQAQVSGKQEQLTSGTNIKTINGGSILGNGNIQTTKTENSMPASGSRLVGNSRYYINGNSSSGFVFYLPSPTQGMEIQFIDMYGNWDSGAWYVGYDATGGKVMGLTENMLVNRSNYNFTLVYADATGGWRIV